MAIAAITATFIATILASVIRRGFLQICVDPDEPGIVVSIG